MEQYNSSSMQGPQDITKTYLYNFDHPYTELLYRKLGFTGGLHCFSYFLLKT